jgi:hypothetical protein
VLYVILFSCLSHNVSDGPRVVVARYADEDIGLFESLEFFCVSFAKISECFGIMLNVLSLSYYRLEVENHQQACGILADVKLVFRSISSWQVAL